MELHYLFVLHKNLIALLMLFTTKMFSGLQSLQQHCLVILSCKPDVDEELEMVN